MPLPLNIMLPSEVVRFAPVSFALATEKITRQIATVENVVFNKILGRAWRVSLIADIVDYSATDNWTAATYNADDLVKWGGVSWIATDTTDTEPNADSVGWDYAPRFTTECNQLLYDTVLAPYLSLCILQGCIPFMTVEATSNGLIRQRGENFDPADMKEVDMVAKSWEGWKTDALINLNYFVTDNTGGCNFPLYEGLSSQEVLACCPELGTRVTNDCNVDGTKRFRRERFLVGITRPYCSTDRLELWEQ